MGKFLFFSQRSFFLNVHINFFKFSFGVVLLFFILIYIIIHLVLFRLKSDRCAYEFSITLCIFCSIAIIPTYVYLVVDLNFLINRIAVIILITCFIEGILFGSIEAEYRKRRLFTLYPPANVDHLFEIASEHWKRRKFWLNFIIFSIIIVIFLFLTANSLHYNSECDLNSDFCNSISGITWVIVLFFFFQASNIFFFKGYFGIPGLCLFVFHVTLCFNLSCDKNEKQLYDYAISLAIVDGIGLIHSTFYFVLLHNYLEVLVYPAGLGLMLVYLLGLAFACKEAHYRKRRFHPLHPALFTCLNYYQMFQENSMDHNQTSSLPPTYKEKEMEEIAPTYLVPLWLKNEIGLEIL